MHNVAVKEHSTYTDYESALDAALHSIPGAKHLPALANALTITISLHPIPELTTLIAKDQPIATGTPHPYRRDVYHDTTTALVYWIIEDGDGAIVYTTTGLDAYQWPDLQPYLLTMLYCVDLKLDKLKASVHFPGIVTDNMRDAFNELADCYLNELEQLGQHSGSNHPARMNELLCRAIDERRRQVTFLAMLRSRWLRDQSEGIGRSQNDLADMLGIYRSAVNGPITQGKRHWLHFLNVLGRLTSGQTPRTTPGT